MKQETKLPSNSDYTRIIEQARERNLEKRRLFIPEKIYIKPRRGLCDNQTEYPCICEDK